MPTPRSSTGCCASGSTAEALPRPHHAPGERHTVRCGPIVHGGSCLARLDDGTGVLVDGAIPDERVTIQLLHRARKTWFARVVGVLEASDNRTVPPCPYVPECGGCDLQHVAYTHQLRLKRAIVADALHRARVPLGDAEVEMHGMEVPWHYRWRGEFHVVPGGAGLADASLGFNRTRSWTTVPVDSCLIHHRTIDDSLPALRDLVRAGGREGLSVLHLTVGGEGEELLVRERSRGTLDAGAVDRVSLGLPEGRRLSTHSTSLHWRGHSFRVSADTFIQVNRQQMEVLYGRVLERLGDVSGRRIIDCYAGIGVLATELVARGTDVVCIEENRAAATLGVRNAELNGIADRLRYVAEPVEDALPLVAEEAPVDAIVLDPPRAGCERRVVTWLSLAGPPGVVYVSCDPATMARDLALITGSGPYSITAVDLVDMFPQTHHIESVVTLRRG